MIKLIKFRMELVAFKINSDENINKLVLDNPNTNLLLHFPLDLAVLLELYDKDYLCLPQ